MNMKSNVKIIVLSIILSMLPCQAMLKTSMQSATPQSTFGALLQPIKDNYIALAAVSLATFAFYKMHQLYKSVNADNQLNLKIQNADIKTLAFPKDFIWGAASSSHQVEGNCTNNNWSKWEKEQMGKKVKEASGTACDHWNKYQDDIGLYEEVGVDAARISIEWSKVQPRIPTKEDAGFDQEAIEHYIDVCNAFNKAGKKVCITLNHYTIPLWFEKIDGFADEKNTPYFVAYCKKMFEQLHDKVYMWFTFNSPDGYAAKSYLTGDNPPGEKNMQRMALVYKNLLQAHVQTYHTLKALPGGAKSRIGILKNIYQLDPTTGNSWTGTLKYPLTLVACSTGRSLQDDCFFDFFTTGKFNIYVPFKANVAYTNKDAIGAFDFIGINYYSHGMMCGATITPNSSETTTDNERYTIYPEGIYRAIKTIHDRLVKPLKNIKTIPMYITENGIATQNEKVRAQFYKEYLYAVSRAIADGYDVRGYFVWSIMDNYEWGSYNKPFGLFHVDFSTQKRTLKQGAKFYQQVIKDFHDKKNIQQALEYNSQSSESKAKRDHALSNFDTNLISVSVA